jgi:hypothetical protein
MDPGATSRLRSLLAALAWIGSSCGASAVEHMRPEERDCPQHGPGFVQVPGTATCIRLGGRVATEYGASARRTSRGSSAFGTGAQVSADTRTETPYGPLRGYVRMRAGSRLDR